MSLISILCHFQQYLTYYEVVVLFSTLRKLLTCRKPDSQKTYRLQQSLWWTQVLRPNTSKTLFGPVNFSFFLEVYKNKFNDLIISILCHFQQYLTYYEVVVLFSTLRKLLTCRKPLTNFSRSKESFSPKWLIF
jgi:hypothetical protein